MGDDGERRRRTTAGDGGTANCEKIRVCELVSPPLRPFEFSHPNVSFRALSSMWSHRPPLARTHTHMPTLSLSLSASRQLCTNVANMRLAFLDDEQVSARREPATTLNTLRPACLVVSWRHEIEHSHKASLISHDKQTHAAILRVSNCCCCYVAAKNCVCVCVGGWVRVGKIMRL